MSRVPFRPVFPRVSPLGGAFSSPLVPPGLPDLAEDLADAAMQDQCSRLVLEQVGIEATEPLAPRPLEANSRRVRDSRDWATAKVPTAAAMIPTRTAPLVEYQPAMIVATDATTQAPSATLTAGAHRRRCCSLDRESATTATANATRPAPTRRTQLERPAPRSAPRCGHWAGATWTPESVRQSTSLRPRRWAVVGRFPSLSLRWMAYQVW